MRPRLVTAIVCVGVVGLLIAFQKPVRTADTPEAPAAAATVRPTWTTGKITGSPEPPPQFTPTRAFPNVKLNHPLLLTRAPGLARLFVAEQGGKIFSFTTAPDARPELFFDAAKEIKTMQQLKDSDELEFLYGLVFHPKFEKNRECFVCYTVKGKKGISNLEDGSRVSRFKVIVPDTGPPRIDPASEEIVLTFLQGGHNGGDLHFGPDGYLYISTGDAATPSPPDVFKTGQDCSDLLSSILRIDIDKKADGLNYAVPKDNPFVNTTHNNKKVRPEIWSYGFRNPWRMSFDRKTGDLWVGDVGWEAWEMIYRIEKGGNYGWSIMEARQPVNTHFAIGPTPILPPTIELDHSQAASITGGYVYRGKKHPSLVGKYIFGDYMTKRVWAATMKDNRLAELVDILPPTVRVVAFGEDEAGELFLVDYDSGTLHSLETNSKPDYDPAKFPRKLSETGLFAAVEQHTLAPGVHGFEVNAAAWNDGATATRFIALPNGSPIIDYEQKKQLGGNIEWLPYQFHFPKDAVLGRTISLELEKGKKRRLETQVLHYDGLYWQAYTYAWRDNQTDADLVPADGSEKFLIVADSRVPRGKREQRWTFHSRTQCLQCHTPWAETTLAFNTLQLNKSTTLDGVEKNQLAALCDLGLIQRKGKDGKPTAHYNDDNTRTLKKLADPADAKAAVVDRARSYLHINCSHCHRFGGGGAVNFELRHDANLKSMLDVAPKRGDFGIPDARLIAPGQPCQSTIYYRMAKFGKDRMPHIGSELPDPAGLALLKEWIEKLKPGKTPPFDPAKVADHLSSADRAIELATRIGNQQCQPEYVRTVLDEVRKLPPGAVRDLFEGYFPPDGKPRTLGPSPRQRAILALSGDAVRGREIFLAEKLQCVKCHKHQDKGIEIGPDLTRIGKDRTQTDLLESLLEPSRRVDAKFQAYTVKTHDGRNFTGLIIKRDDRELVLREANNQEVRLKADNLEEVRASRQSLMPDGLLTDLTPQQAADLLAFLLSSK